MGLGIQQDFRTNSAKLLGSEIQQEEALILSRIKTNSAILLGSGIQQN